MYFVKGHGTENDFVVVPDPEGALALTPALVRALCDRRAGMGADGVLRVVRTEHLPGHSPAAGVQWFMDYLNADGSTAEMCGNGIRLYARYLVASGLAAPGRLRLGTRSGVREVDVGPAGDVTVDMGPAAIAGTSTAVICGRPYEGIHVDIGNPHLVCPVEEPLGGFDLSRPPTVDVTVFPDGVNVELVQVMADRHVAMRVHERGVGETRSCGTGACAAAVAMAHSSPGPGEEWTVDVPGGRLTIGLSDGTVGLTGPAVIVGAGVLDDAWLAAVSG